MLDCRDIFWTVFIAQTCIYCNCKAVFEICGQTFSRQRWLVARSVQSKTPYYRTCSPLQQEIMGDVLFYLTTMLSGLAYCSASISIQIVSFRFFLQANSLPKHALLHHAVANGIKLNIHGLYCLHLDQQNANTISNPLMPCNSHLNQHLIVKLLNWYAFCTVTIR